VNLDQIDSKVTLNPFLKAIFNFLSLSTSFIEVQKIFFEIKKGLILDILLPLLILSS
jgi:hypothetical protein